MLDNLYKFSLFITLLQAFIPSLPKSLAFVAIPGYLLYILFSDTEWDEDHTRWIIVFFIVSAVSSFWAFNIKMVFGVMILYMIPIYTMSMATVKYLYKTNDLTTIFAIFYVAALIMLLMCIPNMKNISAGERLGTELSTDEYKWNANAIGMTLCYAIFLGYIIFYKTELRYLYIFISIIMIIAIMLTGSRKALFMLAIPYIVNSIWNKERNVILSSMVMVLVVSVLGYFVMTNDFLYSAIGHRVEEMINILSNKGDGNGDDSRLMLAQYGIGWFQESPIIGYGLNNFRVLSSKTIMFMQRDMYAHNNYIELLVDLGLVGFTAFYAYVYLIIKRSMLNGWNVWVISFLCLLLFTDLGNVSYYNCRELLIISICIYLSNLDNNIYKEYEDD